MIAPSQTNSQLLSVESGFGNEPPPKRTRRSLEATGPGSKQISQTANASVSRTNSVAVPSSASQTNMPNGFPASRLANYQSQPAPVHSHIAVTSTTVGGHDHPGLAPQTQHGFSQNDAQLTQDSSGYHQLSYPYWHRHFGQMQQQQQSDARFNMQLPQAQMRLPFVGSQPNSNHEAIHRHFVQTCQQQYQLTYPQHPNPGTIPQGFGITGNRAYLNFPGAPQQNPVNYSNHPRPGAPRNREHVSIKRKFSECSPEKPNSPPKPQGKQRPGGQKNEEHMKPKNGSPQKGNTSLGTTQSLAIIHGKCKASQQSTTKSGGQWKLSSIPASSSPGYSEDAFSSSPVSSHVTVFSPHSGRPSQNPMKNALMGCPVQNSFAPVPETSVEDDHPKRPKITVSGPRLADVASSNSGLGQNGNVDNTPRESTENHSSNRPSLSPGDVSHNSKSLGSTGLKQSTGSQAAQQPALVSAETPRSPSKSRKAFENTSSPVREFLADYRSDSEEESPSPKPAMHRPQVHQQAHSRGHGKAPDISFYQPKQCDLVASMPVTSSTRRPENRIIGPKNRAVDRRGLPLLPGNKGRLTMRENVVYYTDRHNPAMDMVEIARVNEHWRREDDRWLHPETGQNLCQVKLPTTGKPMQGPNGEFLGFEGPSFNASAMLGACTEWL